MPNIASVLKDEIARLARKEIRAETERLKKSSAQHRSEIAALKARLTTLEKQVASLSKKSKRESASEDTSETTTRVRFSAKGLAKQRKKLGLSAADFGLLLGVSAPTIYNWEAEKSRPRAKQIEAISALRGIGKRQARARLNELTPTEVSE